MDALGQLAKAQADAVAAQAEAEHLKRRLHSLEAQVWGRVPRLHAATL